VEFSILSTIFTFINILLIVGIVCGVVYTICYFRKIGKKIDEIHEKVLNDDNK